MPETIDYYALLSPDDLTTPTGVFRVRRGDAGLFVESWTGSAWRDGPYTLGRFVWDGEPGADPIDAATAARLTALLPA